MLLSRLSNPGWKVSKRLSFQPANKLFLHKCQAQKHSMSVPDGTFSMGPGTLSIDRRQFHEPIRQSVVARMQEQLAEGQRGIAVLQVGWLH